MSVIIASNCVAGYSLETVPGSATAAASDLGLVTTATLNEDNSENSYFGIGSDTRLAYKAGLVELSGSLDTIVSGSVIPMLAVTRTVGLLGSYTLEIGNAGAPWRFIGSKFNNLRLSCGPGLDAVLTSTMDFMALNATAGAYDPTPNATALDDSIWAPYECVIQVGSTGAEYAFDTEAISFNTSLANNITGLPRASSSVLYGMPVRGYRSLSEGNAVITGEIVTYEDPGVTTVLADCPGTDIDVSFTFTNVCTSGTPSNLVISLVDCGFGAVSQRINAGDPVEFTVGLTAESILISGGA